MDAKQFRELLEVARDFKLESFKLNNGKTGEIEIVFTHYGYQNNTETSNPPNPAKEIDPDEAMLLHIEKLKSQALAGLA